MRLTEPNGDEWHRKLPGIIFWLVIFLTVVAIGIWQEVKG